MGDRRWKLLSIISISGTMPTNTGTGFQRSVFVFVQADDLSTDAAGSLSLRERERTETAAAMAGMTTEKVAYNVVGARPPRLQIRFRIKFLGAARGETGRSAGCHVAPARWRRSKCWCTLQHRAASRLPRPAPMARRGQKLGEVKQVQACRGSPTSAWSPRSSCTRTQRPLSCSRTVPGTIAGSRVWSTSSAASART